MMVIESCPNRTTRSYCAGWRTHSPHKRNVRITLCKRGEAPTGQLHSTPIAVSGSGHTENRNNSLTLPSVS